MSSELLDALHVLEHDKGISRDVIVEAIEAALVSAYKRNFNQAQNVRVELNLENGSIRVFARKDVVDQVFDSRLEISLDEAHKLNPVYKTGDVVELEVTPKDFGRIAAQTAKQVVTQRVREAERGIIYDEFIDREDDIMTGIVERQDSRFIYVNLGKIEAILSQNEQMPNETYRAHDRIKVYLTKVEKTTKGPQIFVSRTHPGLLKRLFEMEVPEIYDGIVEIKSVAREAGDRSKISVYTSNPEVDPVGACVGPKGARVQTIVNELKGEKIDIVEWSDDPFTFVASALSPSKVLDVIVDEEEQATTVVVPDYQLSLAIGKRGQNARLAAKLTGWKIDIKSESVAREMGIYPREESPVLEEEVSPATDASDDEE
ncbi:transcription elongation factor NusA [Listeria fleischmannii 1991]|jgi:N utilization substance protein A|uniref:Transcription termination/antitermination protein NusA n=2 Tax=Listeria fleischmannii TaxID=1069827 RepID=A0A2X3GM48_9LIST|nr:transcription termination factor NusA [Listeria fleischmannii]EMG28175.1 transcription elongation factor NusA [Listeria fleischmannii subsp. fleischmannii LU2006-1]KMT60638.1 transcription elongation factor NusA [Listeria fleischmannii 1991]MBC1419630.1 transcription termination/antitermination protein NusA [Listeria fleischmannii]SQC69358.1 Transcription elongation protein nusA [Listeria fleischmannii subsp. fleischmannii]STY34776.1 Transcription elongation protein nusA [Listeria fleischma